MTSFITFAMTAYLFGEIKKNFSENCSLSTGDKNWLAILGFFA